MQNLFQQKIKHPTVSNVSRTATNFFPAHSIQPPNFAAFEHVATCSQNFKNFPSHRIPFANFPLPPYRHFPSSLAPNFHSFHPKPEHAAPVFHLAVYFALPALPPRRPGHPPCLLGPVNIRLLAVQFGTKTCYLAVQAAAKIYHLAV